MSGIPSHGKPNLLLIATAIACTLCIIAFFAGAENIGSYAYDLIALDFVEYAMYAGIFFVVFWVLAHRFMGKRKLARNRWPKGTQIYREVAFSVSSQFVFLATGFFLAFSDGWGAQNMYTTLSIIDLVYIPFVIFLLLVFDDTYFYWTHRILHHPALFERAHRVHHQSVDPTPFAAFSFHPLEAIVLGVGGLALVPVIVLLPWHPAALISYGTLAIVFNVIGHLGYEVYPRGWNRFPVLRWKTPGYHHYMHHQRVGGNYSLYFRWWDILCKTEFRDYEARYDKIFAESGPKKAPQLK